MILCRQISDVIANENARYKRNELEYSFNVSYTRRLLQMQFWDRRQSWFTW